ncbi:alpha/beta fold hydrolase [Shewanella pealeana]|uniref:Alpha/beta hydrolase fold n=2 Tax=Shewanella pealeana TaxID=70864 RepID=A8H3R6_SHEPA|nr:alpha/beta hydrolase fold [Shewanella pealeana ATCC 700345]
MATVVLIRGLMRDKRHWHNFAELLQKSLSDRHSVIALDTLGNGDLVNSLSPLTIDEYARELLERLNYDSSYNNSSDNSDDKYNNCYLVGLSMGGMIALQMASLQERALGLASDKSDKSDKSHNRIKSVAVINASAANLSPWHERFRFGALFTAFKRRMKGANISAVEACIIALTSSTQRQNIKLVLSWSQYRAVACTSLFNGLRQLWACRQFMSPVALSVPITVLCGREDKLVSPDCSKKLARYYQSKLIEFNFAGHDLSLDSPEKLCQELIESFSLKP